MICDLIAPGSPHSFDDLRVYLGPDPTALPPDFFGPCSVVTSWPASPIEARCDRGFDHQPWRLSHPLIPEPSSLTLMIACFATILLRRGRRTHGQDARAAN
jgi:hypothetical protein